MESESSYKPRSVNKASKNVKQSKTIYILTSFNEYKWTVNSIHMFSIKDIKRMGFPRGMYALYHPSSDTYIKFIRCLEDETLTDVELDDDDDKYNVFKSILSNDINVVDDSYCVNDSQMTVKLREKIILSIENLMTTLTDNESLSEMIGCNFISYDDIDSMYDDIGFIYDIFGISVE